MNKLLSQVTTKSLTLVCMVVLAHSGLHTSTRTAPIDPDITFIQPKTILSLGRQTDTLAAIKDVTALLAQPMTKLSRPARWAFAEVLGSWVNKRGSTIDNDLVNLINFSLNDSAAIFSPVQKNFITNRILPLFNSDHSIGGNPSTFSPLPDDEIIALGDTNPTKQIAELKNLLAIVQHLANYSGTIFLSTVNRLFRLRTKETAPLLNKILQIILLSSTFTLQQKNYVRLLMLPFIHSIPLQEQQAQNFEAVLH